MHYEKPLLEFTSVENRFGDNPLGHTLQNVFEGFAWNRLSPEHYELTDLDLIRTFPDAWLLGVQQGHISMFLRAPWGDGSRNTYGQKANDFEIRLGRLVGAALLEHQAFLGIAKSHDVFGVPFGEERKKYVTDLISDADFMHSRQGITLGFIIDAIDQDNPGVHAIPRSSHGSNLGHVDHVRGLSAEQRVENILSSMPFGNFEGRQ